MWTLSRVAAAGLTVAAILHQPSWRILERVEIGIPATVLTEAGREFPGRIAYISPTAEFTPKSVETREQRTSLVYRVRVRTEDQDGILKQGMPVSVIVRPVAPGR